MCKDWQLCLEEHIIENDYQIQSFTLHSITKYQSKSHMFLSLLQLLCLPM